MSSRTIDFPVFDADNHMYETADALTKYLPSEYKSVIDYIEVHGKTKIVVKGQISDYIPNPTFSKVAEPGVQAEYFKHGNPEGKSRREILGKAIVSPPAFFEPGPRLELMDEQGIDYAIMWPTLASLIEEHLRDDPWAIAAVIHSLNQWMHEQWSFNYEGRIFAPPVINLALLDKAMAELDWVLERGARIILIRPAPVPTIHVTRSMALPEFDPFWRRVAEADIVVGMHASDSGYQRYLNEWEGKRGNEFRPFEGGRTGFAAIIGNCHREIEDTIASVIGHGLCTRFPTLKILPVENGSGWVRPMIEHMEQAYSYEPQIFDEDPVVALKRNVWIHPFHEDDTKGLTELIGVDHVVFGSDYPHPEGLKDPLSFVDELEGMSHDDIAKIMGGNMADLMKVGVRA
jgi:predicted TIM-barrel fold metal-dependent hydrolase